MLFLLDMPSEIQIVRKRLRVVNRRLVTKSAIYAILSYLGTIDVDFCPTGISWGSKVVIGEIGLAGKENMLRRHSRQYLFRETGKQTGSKFNDVKS